jgi:hypothetical protein
VLGPASPCFKLEVSNAWEGEGPAKSLKLLQAVLELVVTDGTVGIGGSGRRREALGGVEAEDT